MILTGIPGKLSYLCIEKVPGTGHRASDRCEESPDSKEHRTGEEPGPMSMGTESATENYRLKG